MIAFTYYLFKVIICSGILFLYYHIALRNKSFHQWNRFYLLFSIGIALVAPIIQVGIVHYTSEETNKAIQILKVFQSEGGYEEDVRIHAQNGFSQAQWLMLLYVVTSGILFAGFVLSLKKINSILRSHSIQWIEKIKFVSTKVAGTPFSFFNFIFWNEEIDLQTETGKQIFQHELVHVREKHTLDKIIIQLVLVVFWCNPFFWLIRRELKLIHEFIADEKSVGEHGTAALAAMILKSSYPTQFNTLTNQFFQTSIKRRLAMLSKIQHTKINYLSRLLALPIVAATVLAFTLKTKTVLTPVTNLEKTMTVVIDAGHGIMEDGKPNGVSVDGVSEDYIVLSIANKIKQLNTNNKLKIVLTRSSDKIVDLHKRVDIAKLNNAALFISLHVDAKPDHLNPGLSSDQSLSSGFEVYVSNKEPAYQTKSEIFGSVLQEELNSVYPTNPYLLKRRVGVWVLDQNICPSVLVECGFLTDEKDRAYITNEGNQTTIAQKILQAIGRYEMSQQTAQKIIPDTIPRKPQTGKVEVSKDGPGNQKLDGIRLNTTKQPLILVDGKEMTKEEMEKIDPTTIESINVLKGDTATAKYGKKGANGAIEIKLKGSKTIREVTISTIPKDTVRETEPLFTKVEKEPSIDKDEWLAFLRQNLQALIKGGTIDGIKPGTYTVKVNFIVKKDGSISNIEALNDPGYGLAEKTVAFMKDCPKWTPALQNGKPVNCYHTQPVTLVIGESN